MRLCICDDNPVHIKAAASIISDYFTLHNLGPDGIITCSPEQLILMLEKKDFPYTAAILDIELGNDLNGIEAAQKINKINPPCQIIFLTGFQKYKLDVYNATHTFFIPKSMMHIYLTRAMDKITAETAPSSSSNSRFLFKIKGKQICLQYDEVIYFEQQRDKTLINTVNTQYTITSSLSSIKDMLKKQTQFVQCHKSFIVNIQFVTEYLRTHFCLQNEITVPISRSFSKSVKEQFFLFTADFISL